MKPSLNRLFVLVLGLSLSSTFVIAQGQVNAEAEIKEGLSYIQARKFKEAVKAFDRAVEKDPQNAFAHYGLALSLANSKEYREAIRPLLRSLQLNPHRHWGNVTEQWSCHFWQKSNATQASKRRLMKLLTTTIGSRT